VLVEYQFNGTVQSATTNADGYYRISGLPAGAHTLNFSKEGYLSYSTTAWIEPMYSASAIKGGGQVDYYDEADAILPELSATVSGIIKKTVGPSSVTRPAVNFPVYARFSNGNYFPEQYVTFTDDKGEFIFENLPATYMNLTIFPVSDADNIYPYTAGNSYYLNAGSNTTYTYTFGRQDGGIYMSSTNLEAGNGFPTLSFPLDENIVLNFTQDVSAEQTMQAGGIILSGIPIDLETDVTFNGSQVIIDPPLDLTASTTYTLSFSVYSAIPGDFTSTNISFLSAE
jgi:hypothetical protein